MTSPAALRALVASLATVPPAAPPRDVGALAPLLAAGVADALRALDDVALLRLCAHGLRQALLLAPGDDAPPEHPTPPRRATTAPVRLTVLPVTSLTSPGEAFRCEAFAATLTAGACVARQRAAQGTWARSRAGVERARVAASCERCGDCATGREVAARVEGRPVG